MPEPASRRFDALGQLLEEVQDGFRFGYGYGYDEPDAAPVWVGNVADLIGVKRRKEKLAKLHERTREYVHYPGSYVPLALIEKEQGVAPLELREGSAAFTAAGGVLQAYAIAKAFHTLTFGSDKERQVAYVGLLGAGMGLVAASLEVGEALYKHLDKAKGINAAMGRARMLKWVAGRISAAGLILDAGLSAANVVNRFETDDKDAAFFYGAQGAFFLGAAYASWMGAQATFAASGVAGAGAASAGMLGLPWTGWGLILIGLGLIAGYVAMRLQDTPTEEWTAKSIWGVADADVKWGSPQREQEELNKLLMGIRVEFEYSTEWIKSLGASAAADTPGVVGEDARIWSKTVTTRLWMPQELRAHLSYMLAVVLADMKGVSTTVYAYSNGQGTMLTRLAGVDEARLQSEADVVVIEIGVDASSYRSAQLEVTIGELAGERQVLVQQLVKG